MWIGRALCTVRQVARALPLSTGSDSHARRRVAVTLREARWPIVGDDKYRVCLDAEARHPAIRADCDRIVTPGDTNA